MSKEILERKYRLLVSKNIREYVENDILPIYDSENVDGGHKKDHIEYVVNRSMMFATEYNKAYGHTLDYDMVYVIGAMHDVGLAFAPRKMHEIASSEYVLNDKNLYRFFNEAQIKIIAEAVRQHRASLDGEPNTLYGKVVSQADRDISLDSIIMRTYEYRRYREPFANNYKLMRKDIIGYLNEKYASDGYGTKKKWFADSEYDKFISDVNRLMTDIDYFDDRFRKVTNVTPEFQGVRQKAYAYA